MGSRSARGCGLERTSARQNFTISRSARATTHTTRHNRATLQVCCAASSISMLVERLPKIREGHEVTDVVDGVLLWLPATRSDHEMRLDRVRNDVTLGMATAVGCTWVRQRANRLSSRSGRR